MPTFFGVAAPIVALLLIAGGILFTCLGTGEDAYRCKPLGITMLVLGGLMITVIAILAWLWHISEQPELHAWSVAVGHTIEGVITLAVLFFLGAAVYSALFD